MIALASEHQEECLKGLSIRLSCQYLLNDLKKILTTWTDARRPVPRLWIRSAEERGERRYENRNTTTTDTDE